MTIALAITGVLVILFFAVVILQVLGAGLRWFLHFHFVEHVVDHLVEHHENGALVVCVFLSWLLFLLVLVGLGMLIYFLLSVL